MRLALPLLLACPAAAQDAPAAFTATYACAGGATLEVAYLNPPGVAALAVVLHDGKLVPMQAGPTGSGVRYVTFGGGEPLVWHTKGKDGFLARDDAEESMLLTDCRTEAEW
jgi:membrane-bound inhibitor of C-type lysozyme